MATEQGQPQAKKHSIVTSTASGTDRDGTQGPGSPPPVPPKPAVFSNSGRGASVSGGGRSEVSAPGALERTPPPVPPKPTTFSGAPPVPPPKPTGFGKRRGTGAAVSEAASAPVAPSPLADADGSGAKRGRAQTTASRPASAAYSTATGATSPAETPGQPDGADGWDTPHMLLAPENPAIIAASGRRPKSERLEGFNLPEMPPVAAQASTPTHIEMTVDSVVPIAEGKNKPRQHLRFGSQAEVMGPTDPESNPGQAGQPAKRLSIGPSNNVYDDLQSLYEFDPIYTEPSVRPFPTRRMRVALNPIMGLTWNGLANAAGVFGPNVLSLSGYVEPKLGYGYFASGLGEAAGAAADLDAAAAKRLRLIGALQTIYSCLAGLILPLACVASLVSGIFSLSLWIHPALAILWVALEQSVWQHRIHQARAGRIETWKAMVASAVDRENPRGSIKIPFDPFHPELDDEPMSDPESAGDEMRLAPFCVEFEKYWQTYTEHSSEKDRERWREHFLKEDMYVKIMGGIASICRDYRLDLLGEVMHGRAGCCCGCCSCCSCSGSRSFGRKLDLCGWWKTLAASFGLMRCKRPHHEAMDWADTVAGAADAMEKYLRKINLDFLYKKHMEATLATYALANSNETVPCVVITVYEDENSDPLSGDEGPLHTTPGPRTAALPLDYSHYTSTSEAIPIILSAFEKPNIKPRSESTASNDSVNRRGSSSFSEVVEFPRVTYAARAFIPRRCSISKMTPLRQTESEAARKRNTVRVDKLLQELADEDIAELAVPKGPSSSCCSNMVTKLQERLSIHDAAAIGNAKVVKSILKKGKWVDTKNMHGETAMQRAAQYSQIEVMAVLVQHYPNVELHRRKDGNTALHLAAEYGSPDAVMFLLGYGADIESRNDKEETPLHRAVLKGREDTARALVENGADVYATDENGDSVKKKAVHSGKVDLVNSFLDLDEQIKRISLNPDDGGNISY